jgi:hypothetical protein
MNDLVSNIIQNAVSSSIEYKSNFDVLIQLAMKYKMHNELLEIIMNDCIEVITAKTPNKIYKSEIHSKPDALHVKTRLRTDTKYEINITDKYRKVLDEIGSNISNYDSRFKLNFKLLRQLEIIEEIYDNINKDNYAKALDLFVKYITIIPFKSEKEINNYLEGQYIFIDDQLKKIIPDVTYLLFYLVLKRMNELNTSFNLKRNE